MTDQAARDALYWRSVADRYEAELDALRAENERLQEALAGGPVVAAPSDCVPAVPPQNAPDNEREEE